MGNISILSIAFIAIGVIFLIIGLAKGFARQFRSLSWLIALAGSVGAVLFLLNDAEIGVKTWGGIYESLNSAIAGVETLKGYAELITNICFGIVIWLVAYIVLKYLLKLISLLFVKLADLPVIKIFDRVIGAIFAVAIAYVIFVGLIYPGIVFVCAQFGGNLTFLQSILDWIKGQATKDAFITFINQTNVIGNLVCNGLDVVLGIA